MARRQSIRRRPSDAVPGPARPRGSRAAGASRDGLLRRSHDRAPSDSSRRSENVAGTVSTVNVTRVAPAAAGLELVRSRAPARGCSCPCAPPRRCGAGARPRRSSRRPSCSGCRAPSRGSARPAPSPTESIRVRCQSTRKWSVNCGWLAMSARKSKTCSRRAQRRLSMCSPGPSAAGVYWRPNRPGRERDRGCRARRAARRRGR